MRLTEFLGLGLVAAVGVAGCTGGGGELAQGQSSESEATTTTVPSTAVTTTPTTAEPTTTTAPTTATSTAPSTEPIPTKRVGGPKTAESAAKTIARVEHGLRGSNRDPVHLQKLGRTQQLAYRALSAHPNWADEVLAAVPEGLRPAVQSNVDAGSALSGLTGTAPAGLPDWQILVPEPAATLRTYYAEGEQTYGIPWQFLAAIHFVETRMGRIHGNSTAGAQGPMQFIPDTWAAYGQGDINSNHDAIVAAARYLEANNAATDIDSALFRYNNDERYVSAIKAYASVIMADPDAYDGFYQWQVFYASADGTFLLPEGWIAS